MARTHLKIAALSGFAVVALGAFGAHALEAQFSPYQAGIWQKAVNYQMFHTLALAAVAILSLQFSADRWLRSAFHLLFFGTVIFSGSLYILAITGIKMLGIVTPVGGVMFLLGWLCLFRFASGLGNDNM